MENENADQLITKTLGLEKNGVRKPGIVDTESGLVGWLFWV